MLGKKPLLKKMGREDELWLFKKPKLLARVAVHAGANVALACIKAFGKCPIFIVLKALT